MNGFFQNPGTHPLPVPSPTGIPQAIGPPPEIDEKIERVPQAPRQEACPGDEDVGPAPTDEGLDRHVVEPYRHRHVETPAGDAREDAELRQRLAEITVAFDKRGLDVPLKKTVAIVAQQNSPTLWVADAGNRRIVQFNKTGEYVRQYKPDDPRVMSDLRGFAVDETAQRFYWLNGTRLYLGTLQN